MLYWFNLMIVLVFMVNTQTLAEKSPLDKDVQADQIVSHCQYKNPGIDQRSRLTIILKGQDRKEQRNVYRRLWKGYDGKNQVTDKMILFTEFPPDAKGVAFMRWGYVPEASKLAEQWIYLPRLKKIRRISVRDLNDSFLGSDLTFGDISSRSVGQDTHRLVKITSGPTGEYFLIESVPKESSSLYGKKMQWFRRTPSWEKCINMRTDYFDRKGELLKHRYIRWQNIKGAWIWDRMLVENVQSYHSSMFIVDQVEVNVGLQDNTFTERTLRSPQR